MTQHIGIWIDGSRAVVATPGSADVVTIVSDVEAHTRVVGSGGGYPGSSSSQGGGSEKRSEARHENSLERFYDDILARIGTPETILVFGPGETKLHFKNRLAEIKGPAKPHIDVESADKLTDAQIVAYVAEHFGRNPTRLLPRT